MTDAYTDADARITFETVPEVLGIRMWNQSCLVGASQSQDPQSTPVPLTQRNTLHSAGEAQFLEMLKPSPVFAGTTASTSIVATEPLTSAPV